MHLVVATAAPGDASFSLVLPRKDPFFIPRQRPGHTPLLRVADSLPGLPGFVYVFICQISL